MDKYQKWTANLVDLQTLGRALAGRIVTGVAEGARCREIRTILHFALCLENNEGKRFLVGMQRAGIHGEPVRVDRLFNRDFGEIEDCDLILVPDLGPDASPTRHVHRFQLVSFVRQARADTAGLIEFLEHGKFRRPADDDLFLVVHLEQEMGLDLVQLSIALQIRRGGCPYRRIFVLGEFANAWPPQWFCAQVYPSLISFKDLDGDTARALLADRKTKCVPAFGNEAS